MISELKIMSIDPASYSRIVQGNGGEEELTITISSGQDGRTALVIVGAQIDGTVSPVLVLNGLAGRSTLPRNGWETMEVIRRALIMWACAGVSPTPQQRIKIEEQCRQIVAELYPE